MISDFVDLAMTECSVEFVEGLSKHVGWPSKAPSKAVHCRKIHVKSTALESHRTEKFSFEMPSSNLSWGYWLNS